MSKLIQLLVIFSAILISSCAQRSVQVVPVSAFESLKSKRQQEISIALSKYNKAIEDQVGAKQQVRLIQIFKPGDPLGTLPTYRIFDISEGSIYQLIGINNRDVIIGIEDRLVFDPKEIRSYLINKLPQSGSGKLRIKRENEIFDIIVTVVK